MNILHLIDSGGMYGAEAMLLDLMTGQKQIGLHPHLCSIGTAAQGEKPVEQAARRRGLDVHALRFRAGLNPAGVYKIRTLAQNCHADMLHSHGYKGNILAGILPRSIRGFPLVSTLHGWTNTRRLSKMTVYEWLDRRLLRYKDAVIAVNRLMLEDKRFKSAQIPDERVYVVNNGIDIEPPRPDVAQSPARQHIMEFCGDNFIIGAIGRLSAEKGFDCLLEAIALLHRAGQNVRLVLIGDGPLRQALQQQAAAAGIEHSVLFTGYLDRASLYLDCFDALAISSISEGLPITLLEAMRVGIPVISTRVGGIPDVIEHGATGMLVEPGDAKALASQIRQLAEHPETGAVLGRRAAVRFRESFTSEQMARAYLDIYRKILPGARP